MAIIDLKAGDQVIIVMHGYPSSYNRCTVDRVTNTQIIIGNSRYRRENGRRIGDDTWHSATLHEITPEMEERMRKFQLEQERLELARKMDTVRWGTLPRETLDAVWALVQQKP